MKTYHKEQHGSWKTKEWNSWNHMKGRCNNPNDPKYPQYGGRGIKVCSRWLIFDNFIEDMGVAPSKNHSIDRINNDGDYEPSNCRWASASEQSNNRRKRKSGYKRNSTPRTKVIGKKRIGQHNGMSKLTDADVKTIFELRETNTLKEIAAVYNVNQSTISRILNNPHRKPL